MRGLKYLLSIDRRFNKDKRHQYAFFFFLFLFSVVPFLIRGFDFFNPRPQIPER